MAILNEIAANTATASHPAAAAYAELLPELAALGEEDLTPITTDVITAVTTVLGTLPRSGRCGQTSKRSGSASILSASTSWSCTRGRCTMRTCCGGLPPCPRPTRGGSRRSCRTCGTC